MGLRGLMSDAEWAFFAPFVVASGPKRGRPPTDHRRILDGVFWIVRTGAPWRDLPDAFGNWSTVFRQYRRWTEAGVWEAMLQALTESGTVPDDVQMIDSTVVRAHVSAAGGKGGLEDRVLAARGAATRPRSTSGPTATAYRSRPSSPAGKPPTTRATVC